ncbi:MAG: hypothetical protein FJX78_02165 [Armatimonadetes bacterium]|nr:hypothetical protein [Armatimonadota bacterium]
MHSHRIKIAALLIAVSLTSAFAGAAYAQDIGGLIKIFGIGYVARQFGPQINDFINSALQTRNAETREVTKVVPILSLQVGLGSPGRATIGAAQVAGPRAAVDRVEAVALLDLDFQRIVGVKVYVPVDNLEPWRGIRRVVGVGVSAIIDLQI